jgi:hypothetical protein
MGLVHAVTSGWRRVIARGRLGTTNGTIDHSAQVSPPEGPPIEIDPDDPALEFFLRAGGAVDLDSVTLEHSPALRALRADGIQLVVPWSARGSSLDC